MIPRLPAGLTGPMPAGEGAFSSVWRARQAHLDRLVAVKILEEKDAARRREWLQEAKTLAQVRLDCVPEVYDAMESGGRVFIVMQWLRGVSLQALLEGELKPARRRVLAVSLCSAVARLHAAGFAHRDLKPANILVCPEPGGRIVLLDFGFARKQEAGKASASGMVKGTPAYMAPELWQTGSADFFKSDLFALGRILREIDPGADWEDWMAPLLAEDPARRPASAVEWWREAEKALSPDLGDWRDWLEPLAAANVAARLRRGAQNLMTAGRHEEAYWLLAESLEENPDSGESLRLFQALPALAGKKNARRRVAAMALVSLILLGLGAAFYSGRATERERGGLVLRAGESRLFLPSQSNPRSRFSTNFKSKDSESPSRLSGLLHLRGAEACGSLSVDGRALTPEAARKGLVLPSGEHELDCLDASGNLLGRERTRILPFQKKTLRLSMESRG